MQDLATNGGTTPDPTELYRLAVEEYRFQAQFNWSRVQYLLAFNAGILAAGVALATASALAAVVFTLGIVACAMTAGVHRVSHDYYRNARDRMRRIEGQLGIEQEARVDTTSTLAGVARKVSVTKIVYLLLTAIAVADLASIVAILVG